MRKWCQVQVLKNGRLDWPYEYARVSAKVEGFFGGMTRDVRTDDRGIATIEWSSDNDLEEIYVSGQTFDGPFENGRMYKLPYEV
jgi:hypothetical protein